MQRVAHRRPFMVHNCLRGEPKAGRTPKLGAPDYEMMLVVGGGRGGRWQLASSNPSLVPRNPSHGGPTSNMR